MPERKRPYPHLFSAVLEDGYFCPVETQFGVSYANMLLHGETLTALANEEDYNEERHTEEYKEE